MTTSLALHHFTIADTSPTELVTIAAETGCDGVCVFVNSPFAPAPGQDIPDQSFPVVTRTLLPEMRRHLRDCGVSVTNIEFFPLGADLVLESFRDSLAVGAELGAQLAVAHIHDPEPARALESLVRFGELAAEYDLGVGLEFMGLSPPCGTLAMALRYVREAGQPNIGVAVDALHLRLTGGSPANLMEVDPQLLAYAQLCDGPDYSEADLPLTTDRYMEEAFERAVPGEGNFPLAELVRALPPQVPLDVEVPLPGLAAQGVSPLERARRAVNGASNVLKVAGRL